MRYLKLGSTELQISSVGLGTWAIGGWMWGGQESADSIAAIHAALDTGINWIDTAPIYGSGKSEEIVGQAVQQLSAAKRPLIFTKFGLGDDSANPKKAAGQSDVVAECEKSLKRLRIERIDLYQLHWPAPQPISETASACEALLKAGKIGAIGVSNFNVEQLDEWIATGVPLHALQAPYSILRPAAERDVLPWCALKGVGAIAYSPLFRGLLFGSWTVEKKFSPDDGRSNHKDYSGPRFLRHLLAVEKLKAFAKKSGLSCSELCIGALLREPGLTGCIVGARNAAQGKALAQLGNPINAEQLAMVRKIISDLNYDLAKL